MKKLIDFYLPLTSIASCFLLAFLLLMYPEEITVNSLIAVGFLFLIDGIASSIRFFKTKKSKTHKDIDELIEELNEKARQPFHSPKFGDTWKEYAKSKMDKEEVINITHYQGRRALMLEEALRKILEA